MANNKILIASASADKHAYEPVSDILERKGYDVVLYRTDRVVSGEDKLNIAFAYDEQLEVLYNDDPIAQRDIGAACLRKVGNFSIANAEQNIAKQLYLNNELDIVIDKTEVI